MQLLCENQYENIDQSDVPWKIKVAPRKLIVMYTNRSRKSND